jgi:hypothetical protein
MPVGISWRALFFCRLSVYCYRYCYQRSSILRGLIIYSGLSLIVTMCQKICFPHSRLCNIHSLRCWLPSQTSVRVRNPPSMSWTTQYIKPMSCKMHHRKKASTTAIDCQNIKLNLSRGQLTQLQDLLHSLYRRMSLQRMLDRNRWSMRLQSCQHLTKSFHACLHDLGWVS